MKIYVCLCVLCFFGIHSLNLRKQYYITSPYAYNYNPLTNMYNNNLYSWSPFTNVPSYRVNYPTVTPIVPQKNIPVVTNNQVPLNTGNVPLNQNNLLNNNLASSNDLLNQLSIGFLNQAAERNQESLNWINNLLGNAVNNQQELLNQTQINNNNTNNTVSVNNVTSNSEESKQNEINVNETESTPTLNKTLVNETNEIEIISFNNTEQNETLSNEMKIDQFKTDNNHFINTENEILLENSNQSQINENATNEDEITFDIPVIEINSKESSDEIDNPMLDENITHTQKNQTEIIENEQRPAETETKEQNMATEINTEEPNFITIDGVYNLNGINGALTNINGNTTLTIE